MCPERIIIFYIFVQELQELTVVVDVLQKEVVRAGNLLVRRLKRRDALSRQREARCEVITCLLRKIRENSTKGKSNII